MFYSKESNPSSCKIDSLNKSIPKAIRLTFALPQFLSKEKIKDEGKATKQKVHTRIRWHLNENQESFTFFVNTNHMDNENDIK